MTLQEHHLKQPISDSGGIPGCWGMGRGAPAPQTIDLTLSLKAASKSSLYFPSDVYKRHIFCPFSCHLKTLLSEVKKVGSLLMARFIIWLFESQICFCNVATN